MTVIVHLEDEGPLRDIFKIALTSADPNLEFKQFEGSDEALDYIKDNHDNIAAYVLDIRVPGEVDGVGVAKKIREFGSNRPIVMTSAYLKPDASLMKTLDCMWMPKPWHLVDTARKILPLVRKSNISSKPTPIVSKQINTPKLQKTIIKPTKPGARFMDPAVKPKKDNIDDA